jgi:glycosyltransferase involved in cell wall biosynthesis
MEGQLINLQRYSILIVCDQIYSSADEFESFLTSKLYVEFEKHYNVSYIGFVKKGCKISEPRYSSFKELPFYNKKVGAKIGNFIYMNWIKFIELKKFKADLIWMIIGNSIHYIFYFLFPVIYHRKLFFVQLGAVDVNKSRVKRFFYNTICGFNLLFYKHIGINPNMPAGKVLIKKHKIPQKKIIPVIVGMPDYGFNPKKFDWLRLAYIGTLNTREIWKSIRGVALFKIHHPEIKLTYDIIGAGNVLEQQKIINEIGNGNLNKIVRYHGPLSVDEVKKIFIECNVGISYIPKKDYFENNSTKTVEYLLAGMAVIATDSKVLREIVKPESGVLCEDNPEDFAKAIFQIYNNFPKYDSNIIRAEYEKLSISTTMSEVYFPAIDKLIRKH